MFAIYSFDGYKFKALWWDRQENPVDYEISEEKLALTFMKKNAEGYTSVRETVLFTSNGLIVSTEPRPAE